MELIRSKECEDGEREKELDARVGRIVRKALTEIVEAERETVEAKMVGESVKNFREKFLGKAENKPRYYGTNPMGYYGVIGALTRQHNPSNEWPNLRFIVVDSEFNTNVAAFLYESERNKYVKFLNGETECR